MKGSLSPSEATRPAAGGGSMNGTFTAGKVIMRTFLPQRVQHRKRVSSPPCRCGQFILLKLRALFFTPLSPPARRRCAHILCLHVLVTFVFSSRPRVTCIYRNHGRQRFQQRQPRQPPPPTINHVSHRHDELPSYDHHGTDGTKKTKENEKKRRAYTRSSSRRPTPSK